MKKLILISALLFSFNGWAQVSDDEIDNLLLTAETDYFNLPFFNSEDNNGKPKKDPFETEDEYQLRLEKWVPKTPKNINFILSKGVSANEYNADNESWDHKIWNPESLGYFSRNYEESTYIGSNAFGAEREIVKRTGDTGKFTLINISKDTVISIPMERDLARDIYADLEFIYVIEVNPDKSFFSSSWRRTYPEIDFTFDTAMTDYNVKAVLKAIVLKNMRTDEYFGIHNAQTMIICPSDQEIIPYKEPKKKRRVRGAMTEKVAVKLTAATELIQEEKNDEALQEINEIMAFAKLTDYERAYANYFYGFIEMQKENYEEAIGFNQKVLQGGKVPLQVIYDARKNIVNSYLGLEKNSAAINEVDDILAETTLPSTFTESDYIYLQKLKATAALEINNFCMASFITNYLLDNHEHMLDDSEETKEALIKIQEAADFNLSNSFSTF